VSIKVMGAVWDHADANGTMLLLLLALADYSNEAGLSWPSVATLARKIRRSRRQTFTLLHQAEQLGLLSRDSGGKKGEHKRSNHYRLTLPMGEADSTGAMHSTHPTGEVGSTSTGEAHSTPPVKPTAPKPSGNRQVNRHLFARTSRAIETDYDSVFDRGSA
jgi:hypothetical protein